MENDERKNALNLFPVNYFLKPFLASYFLFRNERIKFYLILFYFMFSDPTVSNINGS